MDPIIKVQCLKHIYPDKTEVSFCGNDFTVYPGEKIVILGSNGSGKTTLLLHILGLLSPVEGYVSVMGMDPVKNFNNIRKSLGVLFQNTDEQIIGPRVYDDIAFSLNNMRMDKKAIEQRVLQIAKILKIDDILNKIPHYLSGGQKKKVALAGAIITQPEILVLDEPFALLDPVSRTEIMNFINQINRELKTTVILTTHDINIVAEIADKVFVIDKGKTIWNGTPEEIFSKTELLYKSNLEPPILSNLFVNLKKRGMEVEIPYTLAQAEEEILKLTGGLKKGE